MLEIVEGDMVVEQGISYVVEKNEDGTLYGVSNDGEEVEIDESFEPDAVLPLKELSEWLRPDWMTGPNGKDSETFLAN
tara:strand:+ start:222 stop:455 length:234 start_codon:yes stop_codon:yes gene_type:complete